MGIFLLAAAAPERAVIWSFGFYLLNLLVPIIPAVIIYRLFPAGKAGGAHATGNSVEGSVAGWKIKAVGAWGAYVTAFALGIWAIKSTAVPLIKAVGGASVWTVDSDFKFIFTDERGVEHEIRDVATDHLEVEPPMVKGWGKHAKIRLFSETLDPPETINVKMQGYYPTIVPVPAGCRDGKIRLSEPVKLQRLAPIDSSAPTPVPLPRSVGPPPIVTETH
jgi:hypothetical protein